MKHSGISITVAMRRTNRKHLCSSEDNYLVVGRKENSNQCTVPELEPYSPKEALCEKFGDKKEITLARLIDGFVYDAGQKAVKRIAHFPKQTGKVKVPEWSDLVKLGVTKDMAPESTQSEDGLGRILSKQGRKDLNRIAADLRSTTAPAELYIVIADVQAASQRGGADVLPVRLDGGHVLGDAELDELVWRIPSVIRRILTQNENT
ncbi:hypothetical protein PRIPAC_90289 [Pristionchus pacificus]|uniref:Ribosomal protein n=1 Tax=Pristionchus pacificus TaxID=54126 RepID=A0A2A6CXX5_PRIPA|nr:hypothetical protein PRIPAC_90289 [Pristionchus pacificus]|eukprot:PDM83025.1 ribosomal protein [Pristionchus pacificus]